MKQLRFRLLKGLVQGHTAWEKKSRLKFKSQAAFLLHIQLLQVSVFLAVLAAKEPKLMLLSLQMLFVPIIALLFIYFLFYFFFFPWPF